MKPQRLHAKLLFYSFVAEFNRVWKVKGTVRSQVRIWGEPLVLKWTAGVYLLLRLSPLLEFSSTSLAIITLIGSFTALYSAITALWQTDIKKVIAYSTCSQLGYLLIAIGCSNQSIGLFHLINHAFFKALLFLSAGSILHTYNDQQDMRKMGGIIHFNPFIYTLVIIASFSLMALPFLTGYTSKDILIETAFGRYIFISSLGFIWACLTAILTAFYSIKLIIM